MSALSVECMLSSTPYMISPLSLCVKNKAKSQKYNPRTVQKSHYHRILGAVKKSQYSTEFRVLCIIFSTLHKSQYYT